LSQPENWSKAHLGEIRTRMTGASQKRPKRALKSGSPSSDICRETQKVGAQDQRAAEGVQGWMKKEKGANPGHKMNKKNKMKKNEKENPCPRGFYEGWKKVKRRKKKSMNTPKNVWKPARG